MLKVSVRLPKDAVVTMQTFGRLEEVVSFFLENWAYDTVPESFGSRTGDSQYVLYINSPKYEAMRAYYAPNSPSLSIRRIVLSSLWNSTIINDFVPQSNIITMRTRIDKLLDIKTGLLQISRFCPELIKAVDIVDVEINKLCKTIC